MIKIILVFVLVAQVFSLQRNLVLNYYDQILLKNLANGVDFSVKLQSLPGNDATVPITLELRQIKDVANPLVSTVLASQVCTFGTDKTCKITFLKPIINSAYKYTLRLQQKSTLSHVNVIFTKTNSGTASDPDFIPHRHLSSLKSTSPGFKFYAASAGQWTFNFGLISLPSPTVTSYDFKLWSLNGNLFGTSKTKSATTPGNVTFTIDTSGYYFLSFALTISKIDVKTKYPIKFGFNFNDDICPNANFFDPVTQACKLCSTDKNSKGTATVSGICDCNTNYFWKQTACVACVGTCPQPNTNNPIPQDNKDNHKPNDNNRPSPTQKLALINYFDQIVLKNLVDGNDFTIKLSSPKSNDASVPITLQLREIKDVTNPLVSTQLAVQTCNFGTDNTCTITFVKPTINSAYKYTLRLAEASTLSHVIVNFDKPNTVTASQGDFNPHMHLTPLKSTNPGFKFYAAAAGTWQFTFTLASFPSPTISSFDFKLWLLNGNQLTTSITQSITSPGKVSFTIFSAGYYYLSFNLIISKIDSTTQYPIRLGFIYPDNICPTGNYWNQEFQTCNLCSTLSNTTGTTTVIGICDCASGYQWRDNACLSMNKVNPQKNNQPPPPQKNGQQGSKGQGGGPRK